MEFQATRQLKFVVLGGPKRGNPSYRRSRRREQSRFWCFKTCNSIARRRPSPSQRNSPGSDGIRIHLSLMVNFGQASSRVIRSATGVDLQPTRLAPSQQVSWLHINLDGSAPICGQAFTKLLHVFQPGFVIGSDGGIRADPAVLGPVLT